MTAMALGLSPELIIEAKASTKHDVEIGLRRVGIALSFFGHLLDSCGSWVVNRSNLRLERNLVHIKGLVALVPDLDPSRVIDPHNELANGLSDVQRQVQELQKLTLQARGDIRLRKTHAAFREGSEVCAALYEAMDELKKVIAEHDSKATMSDDVRRLMADLKRTDDVPAGRYAELAAVLRKLPTRDEAEDRRGNPPPL